MTETDPGAALFARPTSYSQGLDGGGGFGGVQIELNRQLGHWVIGSELALSGAQIKGSVDSNCFGNDQLHLFGTNSVSSCNAEISWLLTMLGRVGYAQDRWMVYGAAGWALAGVEVQETTTAFNIIPTTASISETADGFAFGAGV